MKDSILIIDDDEQITDILGLLLENEGYQVRTCATLGRAHEFVQQYAFALILLDIRLSDGNGIEFLPRLREHAPNVPVFIITAHGDVDSAVDAFTWGANGYIKKPFKEGDLKAQIGQAIEAYKLKLEIQGIKSAASSTEIRDIIPTHDPAMDPLLKRIATAAQVTSTVVISGESGTGKELVARALHKTGPRRKGPFIAFNCAAVPENLLESELFGYMRGAFTDAKDNKLGLFTRAHGGTLFLDEIGDAPLSIQSKLLRVLQEREIMPLGATTATKIDVRVVAATHKCLKDEVEAGRFRQDLFYRLHVLPLQVPALRERPKDILFLGQLFATRLSETMSLQFEGFTQRGVEELLKHAWPGNVRELQNRIEQALAMSQGGRLSAKLLFPELDLAFESMSEPVFESPDLNASVPGETTPDQPPALDLPTFGQAKISFERNYLERVLTVAKGNIAKAARLASKSRAEVYGLLRKHGLDAGAFKQQS
ncbi:sigma-54 dependent transcriptional regulator [Bdellovibrionota bacterium FG-1]